MALDHLRVHDARDASQILDKIAENPDTIYNGLISVYTHSGVFTGTLVAKGSGFVILREETRVRPVNAPEGEAVWRIHNVATAAIVAITYEMVGAI